MVTNQMKERFLEMLGSGHAADYPQQLELQFPHVFETIVSLCGTTKMDDYFQDLLLTARTGRQGFPEAAATEILRLFFAYQSLGLARPAAKTTGTGWDWVDHLGYFGQGRADAAP